jgi:hypothetical protein
MSMAPLVGVVPEVCQLRRGNVSPSCRKDVTVTPANEAVTLAQVSVLGRRLPV